MNKSLKLLAMAAAGAAVMSAAALTVSAEDTELSFEEKASTGSWGQSVTYYTARNDDQPNAFDPCTMTESSVVQVSYETDLNDDNNHIELIWQTWGDHVTSPAGDWNKIPLSEHSKGYSEFTYADIVSAYGTDDFSEVFAICVGDNGDAPVTVTKIVITNVSAGGAAAAVTEETEAETEEVTEAETEAETEEETEAETEEETTAETAEETEAETEEETEAETEEETTAETEEITEKTTQAETEAASSAVPSPAEDETDSGGIILVIIIVIVAAAIGVLIFLTKRKGPVSDSDDWKR